MIHLPPMDSPIEDVFKISLIPSTYILKSCGDRMLSWRTPLVTLMLSEMQAPDLAVIFAFDTSNTKSSLNIMAHLYQ